MTNSARFILSLLSVLVAIPAAHGQQVRIAVSADSVSVAERFFVTVSVDADAAYQVIFPNLAQGPLAIGDVEFIRATEIAEATDLTVTHTDSATYEVAAFGIDSVIVGGISVGIISPTRDTAIVAAPSVIVGIYSVVPENAAGLKDLAPLATFPRSLWPWILGGLGLLAAMALAYYIWRRTRRHVLSSEGPDEVPVDPYDQAISRLRRLSESVPSSDEEIREYHIELSDTLRNYLEFTINVPALERTSAELIGALQRLSAVSIDLLAEDTVGQIRRTLDVSDLAKFANYLPDTVENKEVLDLTLRSIESIEKARQRRLAEAELVEAEA